MTIDIKTINQEANKNFQSSGLRYLLKIDSTKEEGIPLRITYETSEVFNTHILCLKDKEGIDNYLKDNCNIAKAWPAFGDIAFPDRAHAGPGVRYDITYNKVDVTGYIDQLHLMPVLETIEQDMIGCYLREHIGARTLVSNPIECHI